MTRERSLPGSVPAATARGWGRCVTGNAGTDETVQAIGFHRYDGAEVLEPLEVAVPPLADDAVLIRIAAAVGDPSDTLLRSGRFRLVLRVKLPFVAGSDVAGVVAAVGREVTRFQPGDAVSAMLPTATGGAVATAPPSLRLAEAAAVPLAALTAQQALRDMAGLRAGSTVLINGSSGGVGSFAIQIAMAMGASVVAAASAVNAGLVFQLGADEAVDYARHEVTAGPERFDVVFDAVGAHPFRPWRRALRPGGVVVTTNPGIGNPVARLLSRLTGGGRRLERFLVRPSGADLETISAWIAAASIRPVIDRCYPLTDATMAHRHSETKRARQTRAGRRPAPRRDDRRRVRGTNDRRGKRSDPDPTVRRSRE